MAQKGIAIIGMGNIGRAALEAVRACPDFRLCGIVRRSAAEPMDGIPVVSDIAQLSGVDAALLCIPTRKVRETALPLLESGIATVDSFDIHGEVVALRRDLDAAAKRGQTAAVLSAGWDPGTDSMVRALFEAMTPMGISYTDFGPGMSMGHSVVARSKPGVQDALSVTIPLGTGLHRRMVYVQLETAANLMDVRDAILADPYFSHDETHVVPVDDVAALRDMGHGVHLTRKGVSGATHNQLLEFNMRINNPALTAQIMLAAARAALRQRPGAYTMIELPPVDLLPGEREGWVGRLV